MYDGPVIDIHAHLALDRERAAGENHTIGLDGLLAAVKQPRVKHATAIVMAPRDDIETTRSQNDAVLDLAASTDGFLIPVVSVHPADRELAAAELFRVAQRGARMLKLHPNTQEFDVADEEVTNLVRRAGDYGIITLFDGYSPFDPAQPGKFVKLAMSCPDSTLILAHMNGPDFVQTLVYEILGRYPWYRHNVHFDLSATGPMMAGGPYAEHFRWVIRKVGVRQVLYGSDWPFDDPAFALNAFHSLGFTDDEERALLHDNAAALLNL
jgi:predicted TIM-barrel fold metal-dependent hydrolase